jgi:arsenite oxidase large subunit
MTYKRNIDRLPIPPRDAKVQNVTCHYCIVGCGYKAVSWPVNKQGGTLPDSNLFGIDLARQQGAEAAGWYSQSMVNVVKQDGRDVQIVIRAIG